MSVTQKWGPQKLAFPENKKGKQPTNLPCSNLTICLTTPSQKLSAQESGRISSDTTIIIQKLWDRFCPNYVLLVWHCVFKILEFTDDIKTHKDFMEHFRFPVLKIWHVQQQRVSIPFSPDIILYYTWCQSCRGPGIIPELDLAQRTTNTHSHQAQLLLKNQVWQHQVHNPSWQQINQSCQ